MNLPFSSRAIDCIAFLLVLIVTYPAAVRAAPSLPSAAADPHDFERLKKGCKYCHVSVGVKSRGIMQRRITDICAECHTITGHSHPVDVRPTLEIPADLPVDDRGMLTCATCHNIHKSQMNKATGEKTMYLRRDTSRRLFCRTCHKNVL